MVAITGSQVEAREAMPFPEKRASKQGMTRATSMLFNVLAGETDASKAQDILEAATQRVRQTGAVTGSGTASKLLPHGGSDYSTNISIGNGTSPSPSSRGPPSSTCSFATAAPATQQQQQSSSLTGAVTAGSYNSFAPAGPVLTAPASQATPGSVGLAAGTVGLTAVDSAPDDGLWYAGSGTDAAALLGSTAASGGTGQKMQQLEADRAALAAQLSQFTPEVILQELLGGLFIHPSRLQWEGLLGEGAFATVHRASLLPLSESQQGANSTASGHVGMVLSVAVKRLKPEVLTSSSDLKDFLMEVNILRKLRHPNIVGIKGIGAADLSSLAAARASVYVVMEALEGGNLRTMVTRQMTSRAPVYEARDALRWAQHIAAAMHYLHAVCRPMIIHRDMKLENVLLSDGAVDRCVAKLADFGLHKRARLNTSTGVLMPAAPVSAALMPAASGGGPMAGYAAVEDQDKSYYGGHAFYSVHNGNAFYNSAGNASVHYPAAVQQAAGSMHGNKNSSVHAHALVNAKTSSSGTTSALGTQLLAAKGDDIAQSLYAPSSSILASQAVVKTGNSPVPLACASEVTGTGFGAWGATTPAQSIAIQHGSPVAAAAATAGDSGSADPSMRGGARARAGLISTSPPQQAASLAMLAASSPDHLSPTSMHGFMSPNCSNHSAASVPQTALQQAMQSACNEDGGGNGTVHGGRSHALLGTGITAAPLPPLPPLAPGAANLPSSAATPLGATPAACTAAGALHTASPPYSPTAAAAHVPQPPQPLPPAASSQPPPTLKQLVALAASTNHPNAALLKVYSHTSLHALDDEAASSYGGSTHGASVHGASTHGGRVYGGSNHGTNQAIAALANAAATSSWAGGSSLRNGGRSSSFGGAQPATPTGHDAHALSTLPAGVATLLTDPAQRYNLQSLHAMIGGDDDGGHWAMGPVGANALAIGRPAQLYAWGLTAAPPAAATAAARSGGGALEPAGIARRNTNVSEDRSVHRKMLALMALDQQDHGGAAGVPPILRAVDQCRLDGADPAGGGSVVPTTGGGSGKGMSARRAFAPKASPLAETCPMADRCVLPARRGAAAAAGTVGSTQAATTSDGSSTAEPAAMDMPAAAPIAVTATTTTTPPQIGTINSAWMRTIPEDSRASLDVGASSAGSFNSHSNLSVSPHQHGAGENDRAGGMLLPGQATMRPVPEEASAQASAAGMQEAATASSKHKPGGDAKPGNITTAATVALTTAATTGGNATEGRTSGKDWRAAGGERASLKQQRGPSFSQQRRDSITSKSGSRHSSSHSKQGKGGYVFADATRQVGSLMYMAPELVNGHKYNEKVDVFSFGVMLYELFSGKLLACRSEFMMGDEAAVEEYVQQRAQGARERLPQRWPPELRQLVGDCWAQDPLHRPDFATVLERLQGLEISGGVNSLIAQPGGGAASSGCCTIM